MINFSEETPEVHNGNGDGRQEGEARLGKAEKTVRPELAQFRERREAIMARIYRIKESLELRARTRAQSESGGSQEEIDDLVKKLDEALDDLKDLLNDEEGLLGRMNN